MIKRAHQWAHHLYFQETVTHLSVRVSSTYRTYFFSTTMESTLPSANSHCLSIVNLWVAILISFDRYMYIKNDIITLPSPPTSTSQAKLVTLPFEPPSAGRSIVFFFHRLPYQQAPHCSQISFLLIVQYGDSRCLARGPLQALKTMRPIYIYIARVAKQMNQSRSMSCALVRPWTHLARGIHNQIQAWHGGDSLRETLHRCWR